MKAFIFGFGWEILGFCLYALVWGWFCTLLERKVTFFKGNTFLIVGGAILMLHPFVVSYLPIVFWGLMSGAGVILWAPSTKDWLEKNASWITGYHAQLVRIAILIVIFMVVRSTLYQYHPERMWY